MAVANLYFDESGSHHGSKLLTVAGYWFDSVQAHRFARDWAKDLKQLGLTHAHMSDCALGFGEYHSLSMQDRIKSEKLLIENIKRRTRFGFAITLDPVAYSETMKGVIEAPACYTVCLMMLFHQITLFADANNYEGQLVYFFESGHESANEAHAYLNGIPAHGPEWVKATRYGGHAFVDKRAALPLQAADMLAWQVRHYFERSRSGHTVPRKDLVALLRPFDLSIEMRENGLIALRDAFLELAPLVNQGDNVSSAFKLAEIYNRHGLSISPSPRFKC